MKNFEIGKYYQPATTPSIAALKCVKVSKCYIWLYDDEKNETLKLKKRIDSKFIKDSVESWEAVTVYGYELRAIDD